MASEATELLDVFRAAAFSVTKLYKAAASAQAKARADGYQDCLDELLLYLDKQNLGVGDGEGWKIRQWATERLEGRDATPPTIESEDDAEKAETASSPEPIRTSPVPPPSTHHSDPRKETQHVRMDSAPPTVQDIVIDEPEIAVPTLDTFDFRSAHPYPNIANLDLSDSGTHEKSQARSTTRHQRTRHVTGGGRSGARASTHLGRGSGQKRKVNYKEFFGLGNDGLEKDAFGGSSKKPRRS